MEILTALGVDSTIGYQFAIFVVVYSCLYFLVFKPYFKAFEERKNRTVGNQEIAEKYLVEATELQSHYETEARALNAEIKSIFDKRRTEALREYENLVGESRNKAQIMLERARQTIQGQVDKARAELAQKTTDVSKTIIGQVLGKEVEL